jgi:hypothetical protein
MHLAGHTHRHHTIPVHPTTAPHAYWDLETSALADYPFQMRLIEIWDLDNGFIGIKAIVFDYSAEGDPVATEGRRRAILDYTSGWATSGTGDVTDRNIELIMPKP